MQRAPPCQSLTSDERPATQAHSSSPTFLRDYRPSCHLSPLICQFNLISLVLFQALSSSRPSFSTSSCQKLINGFSFSAGPPLKICRLPGWPPWDPIRSMQARARRVHEHSPVLVCDLFALWPCWNASPCERCWILTDIASHRMQHVSVSILDSLNSVSFNQ